MKRSNNDDNLWKNPTPLSSPPFRTRSSEDDDDPNTFANQPTSSSSPAMNSITVILICGLPASGKSFLARKIQEHYKSLNNNDNTESHTGRIKVVHLEYDCLEDFILVSKQQEQQQQESQHPQELDRLSIEAWNQARLVAIEELEQLLVSHTQPQTRTQTQNSINHDNNNLLILMDDNFHLRGMRKQIHRLLLKYQSIEDQNQTIQFGILWMETSLQECLERNRSRKRSVPEHVLSKMQSTMEPPRAMWEKYWLSVTTNTSDSNSNNDNTSSMTPPYPPRIDMETIINFINACPEIVELPNDTVDQEQQQADRLQTAHNAQHSLDNLLRSWVGGVAKWDKKLARNANVARKQLLQQQQQPQVQAKDDTTMNTNSSVNVSGLLDKFVSLVLSDTTTTATSISATSGIMETNSSKMAMAIKDHLQKTCSLK